LSRLVASSEDLLVIDLGFRECDGPFVVVLFHFVLLLFAGVLFLFALLRFKPLAKLGIKTEVS
jgi:hypothetical protein